MTLIDEKRYQIERSNHVTNKKLCESEMNIFMVNDYKN